jgi:uncharacterized protein with FMN-binding domain
MTFWLLSTLSAVVLLFGYDRSPSASVPAALPSTVISTSGDSGSGSGTSGSTVRHATTNRHSRHQRASKSSSRTVTGGVASTQWGPVQVQLTVRGGTITKVGVLQQPSGTQQDAQINGYALPILMQETTSSQTANIDMVSGATVTSTGYIQSLQSAIDQAGL